MSIYFEVVLRAAAGHGRQYFCRIDPGDFGYSSKEGAGGRFDQERLPALLDHAEHRFGTAVVPIWVDDAYDPDPDWNNGTTPWDGPGDLYSHPPLSYLVPDESDRLLLIDKHP